ncbi:MAG: AAA family ATPase [Gammaproteobacteria bacterium]|nr:AAA family ATPase [Gammaproteobacteria bacterium]MDE0413759.1 AAA family ATPase [Gammaproteobacteria bacterium]
MPSANRILLASAGSGKTTTIVSEAAKEHGVRSALVTYTNNSEAELRIKANGICGCVPPHLRTATWFGFLLQHLVRPYQRAAYARRVRGLAFVNGMSARWTKEADTQRHYFERPGDIYVDKVSKFACKLIRVTRGKPVERLAQIVDRIYVDEVQDLAGYDLDLIEHLMDSNIQVVLVGDHRQATFKTNQSGRNRQFGRQRIIDKFKEWQVGGRAEIEIHSHSYRCVQQICDVADSLFPDVERTISRNHKRTGHDGVFLVRQRDVPAYVEKFSPQTLRYSRRKRNVPGNPYNFGEAKGMTFERVLIFPHKPLEKYCLTRKLEDAGKELPKIYVAMTRARQSVGIVVPNRTEGGIARIHEA